MKLEMIMLQENEDGSATMEFEYDEEAKQMLMEAGINAILKEYLNKLKKENE